MTFKICSFMVNLSIGIIISSKNVEIDYTYWLGPNYKTIDEEKLSTYVSNHCGFADNPTVLHILGGKCSFLAADKAEKTPIVGTCLKYGEAIFVPSGGSPESL